MKTRFYLDEHVNRAVTAGLRRRGVDVLTAQEDGRAGASDDALVARASELGRVVFSQDADLLAIAKALQERGLPFSGLIYGHQLECSIGDVVEDLELIAGATTPGELDGVVVYLPL